jgi:outer membrane receptor protein involved in Fe transport
MPRSKPRWRRRSVALAALAATASTAQAQTPPSTELPPVEIVGTTPVPGTGVPKDRIPSNVQTANDKTLRRSQSLNLPDFMASRLPSVNVNEIQGNPFQMDVNFRGFTASPLLGTPQGLSVFQDGVRINEPFGDIVNWDLIPKAALASITLLPGSNPLFGLNTLGGALSLQTKSGDTHPGTEVEVQGGSFGRFSTELTHGRRLGDNGHLFMAFSSFDEDGWRDHSPSKIRQFFAKGGQHDTNWSWDLSLTHGDNSLVGNGLLPESMLAERRKQIYTRPDQTHNRMTLLSLNASVQLAPQHVLAMTAYHRSARAATLNGDLNDDYDPPEVDEAGVENRTHTRQRGEGLALQLTSTLGAHRVVLGASHDRARSHFEQTEAEGALDGTRAVVDTEEAEVDALISGRSRTSSVYVSDLIELNPGLHLTLSGRYNDTRVKTVDVGRATLGLDTNLDGEGHYKKFNPAAGLTWQLTSQVTAYGGYSQGNRAPSPIELGCSDPENACVLPNALQSDPPLKQVVSRTLEAGLRGTVADAGLLNGLRWNASVFRTVNRDDLLFISNGLAAGYFTNFGRTVRQGIELGLARPGRLFDWAVSYSYLRATFDSSACLVSESNSTAETSGACTGEGEIEVRPGNHLPGLPKHSLKLSLDFKPTATWTVGAQLNAFSGQFVRGNENNAHQADGDEFNGAGRIGGFALLNLSTSWKFARGWELFGKVTNVFDRKYASAGLLGENAFGRAGALLAPADWRHEQFVGPGAPRAAWVGLRWSME